MVNLLSLMCGTDIPIPECQLTLHQPKMKEIALIGESDFFIGVQCLGINKNMISQGDLLLSDTSNFQIFMTIMQEKQTADKKQAVMALFNLLFPTKKIILTPRSLIFTEGENNVTIDESNFDFLQEAIKDVFCVNSSANGDQTVFNPQDERAREIAQKLMQGRQRVAEQKGGEKTSIFSQYISVLTVAIPSMSIHDCANLTMFQMYDLVERYGLWVNWDLDVRSRLAGGSPDSKPDNWMKNIH